MKREIEGLVKEWLNVQECDVLSDGSIWVANPVSGHFLSEERKKEFYAWSWAKTHDDFLNSIKKIFRRGK